jgi:hypothetical protein
MPTGTKAVRIVEGIVGGKATDKKVRKDERRDIAAAPVTGRSW